VDARNGVFGGRRLELRIRVLSNDKVGLLKSLLGSLPGAMAARLARAVEVDRLMEGAVLPHAEILSGLRPQLRNDNLERTPTPLRLFCLPFQDILTNAPRGKKQKAIIARTSVVPVWQWLSQTLIPAECAAFMIETKAMILCGQFAEAQARAADFRAAAAQAIGTALSDPSSRKAARALLGGDLVLADADEIALLLPIGEAVKRIGELVPRPVASLDDSLLWELRAVYDGLVQTRPDAAPYVAAIAMNKLARPWEALKLPMMISRQHHDALISQTDMGLVGEILIARMDGLQAAIQATRHPYFDAEKLIDEVRSFGELSTAVVKEIEIRRDGEWGQRLLKERQTVGGVMEGFMERAEKEFAAALPMQKGAGRSADFSRPIDADRHEMARRYVRLVSGCRRSAAAACFAAKQKDAQEALCAHLQRYNEDVVKELRSADPARKSVAEAQFAVCVEFTEALFSGQEAALLRRRGRAAIGGAERPEHPASIADASPRNPVTRTAP
jgi:hypothetical protein